MREILFRGRNENSTWIYGSLLVDKDTFDKNAFIYYICDIDGYSMEIFNTKTIGQYTGLCDKNGTKIFEGDILSAHLDDGYPENETILEVVWHNNGWYGKNGKFFDDFDNGFEKYFEVIGNIHDNPELLKE